MSSRALKSRIAYGPAWTAVALLASACGSQQFATIATTQQAQAPGILQLAPKVDVILVEDDTGRIQDQYNNISSQAQGFLNSLDQQGWNYRFATVRLTTLSGPITQAVTSKHDPNWGSQWVAPFPGAQENQVDTLSSSIFTTNGFVAGFNQYFGFLQPGQATNILNGQEPGLLTLTQSLSGAFGNAATLDMANPTSRSFFRSDALLAVVLVGTGNDTSYVNMCRRANNTVFPCETVTSSRCSSLSQVPNPTGWPVAAYPSPPLCGSSQLSLNYFHDALSSLPGLQPGQLKFYSAVAGNSNNFAFLCQGGMASQGVRYQQLAAMLGGKSYDVCSQSLSSVLTDVAQNLTTTAINFERAFVVLKQQPNPTTLQLVKFVGGNPARAVTIPNDPVNGWTYIGFQTEYVIDYPIQLDRESGYMIQLNGSAKLTGADTAAVTYKTPGGTSVVQ